MDLLPQEFMKAWKKIRSGKENKEWNGMEWEVHNKNSYSTCFFLLIAELQDCYNCIAKGWQCEHSAASKCCQCTEDHGKGSWVQDFH